MFLNFRANRAFAFALILLLAWATPVFAQPAPVRFHGQLLFEIKTPTPNLTSAEAVNLTAVRLEILAANRSFDLSTLQIEPTPNGHLLRANADILFLVTTAEAAAHQRDGAALAVQWLDRMKAAIETHRATTSFRFWLDVAGYFSLYTLLFVLAVWLLNWLQHKARSFADSYTKTHLAERSSRNLNLFSTATLLDSLRDCILIPVLGDL